MSIPVDIGPLVNRISSGFWDAVGKARDRFTQGEIDLCEACFEDAAKTTVLALADPEKARIIKKSVDAQLANIKVAGEVVANQAASEIVWRVVGTILEVAVPLLLKSVLK